MDLEERDIKEFQDIWQQEFGETLSPEQARLEASLLLELYSALARPLPAPPDAASPEIS